ncbi:MAG: hypothetical protein KDC05_17485, partial [Bacteroidales bacterium]|nr:hypothetical protein [Bacteroidales bacterium]
MKKTLLLSVLSIVLIFESTRSIAQEYSFEDFVGTWHGTIFSPSTNGSTVPMTMEIQANGFYTETSGALMPSLYPNTQECEYEASTNRMHWWYLGTAWGGQYFYDHFYYEVVYFQNDTLEMHYNYWDDPMPHPGIGTIMLVKENLTPAPAALQLVMNDFNMELTWTEPQIGSGNPANPDAYNVYYKMDEGPYTLLETTTNTGFSHENVTMAGSHGYYVTAVYGGEESGASNQVEIVLTTPEPTALQSQLLADNVVLNWDEPEGNLPIAMLQGYNIYHKFNDDEFALLMFTESNFYTHQEILPGMHSYYVTAVYDGAESEASNEVVVEFLISGIED